MTDQAYAKPLSFSAYHGSNIFLSENGFRSNGQYLQAHGQFITQKPFHLNETFDLEFQGTGIVKFTTFLTKNQAINWILQKKPLPQGCKRIKMKGVKSYRVTVSTLKDYVRIESQMKSKKEVFHMNRSPETTLAFDIECGDIAVLIFNTATSSVTFDNHFHSPNIEITTSQGIPTATLRHYNPSALCCVDNTSLETGATFMLKVRHFGLSRDSGSYLRVCVSPSRSPYINDSSIECCGTSSYPPYRGKILYLAKGRTEILRVKVTRDGLVLDRQSKSGLDVLNCLVTSEYTLWFELHKVSLQVWQIKETINRKLEQRTLHHQQTSEASPPGRPPPPPPCYLRSKPTPGERQSRQFETEGKELHQSEAYSAVRRNKAPYFKNSYASYVSPDSLDQLTDRMSQPCQDSATLCSSPTAIPQCDLSNMAPVDTTTPELFEIDLVTLSSIESLYDSRNGGDNPSKNQAENKSHYERPERVWSRSKAKPCKIGISSSGITKRKQENNYPNGNTINFASTLNTKEPPALCRALSSYFNCIAITNSERSTTESVVQDARDTYINQDNFNDGYTKARSKMQSMKVKESRLWLPRESQLTRIPSDGTNFHSPRFKNCESVGHVKSITAYSPGRISPLNDSTKTDSSSGNSQNSSRTAGSSSPHVRTRETDRQEESRSLRTIKETGRSRVCSPHMTREIVAIRKTDRSWENIQHISTRRTDSRRGAHNILSSQHMDNNIADEFDGGGISNRQFIATFSKDTEINELSSSSKYVDNRSVSSDRENRSDSGISDTTENGTILNCSALGTRGNRVKCADSKKKSDTITSNEPHRCCLEHKQFENYNNIYFSQTGLSESKKSYLNKNDIDTTDDESDGTETSETILACSVIKETHEARKLSSREINSSNVGDEFCSTIRSRSVRRNMVEAVSNDSCKPLFYEDDC